MQTLKQIRHFSSVPIVIVTGRGDEAAIVTGLEAGACDYVVKPFKMMELLARVKGALSRSLMPELRRDEGTVAGGGLVIDLAARQVTVEGRPVRLTPSEWRLLYVLARNEGMLVPHGVLMSRIWGAEEFEDSSPARTLVRRLRAKLGEKGARAIMSERGLGYRLVLSQ